MCQHCALSSYAVTCALLKMPAGHEVMQKDEFFPTETPREAIYFSARPAPCDTLKAARELGGGVRE